MALNYASTQLTWIDNALSTMAQSTTWCDPTSDQTSTASTRRDLDSLFIAFATMSNSRRLRHRTPSALTGGRVEGALTSRSAQVVTQPLRTASHYGKKTSALTSSLIDAGTEAIANCCTCPGTSTDNSLVNNLTPGRTGCTWRLRSERSKDPWAAPSLRPTQPGSPSPPTRTTFFVGGLLLTTAALPEMPDHDLSTPSTTLASEVNELTDNERVTRTPDFASDLHPVDENVPDTGLAHPQWHRRTIATLLHQRT